LLLVNFKSFEDIGKKVRTDSFGGMNWDRSPTTIRVMEYGMTALLSYLLKAHFLKTFNYFTGFEWG